ncbi:hypothetical protein GCM10027442_14740 [Emticicia fontis]
MKTIIAVKKPINNSSFSNRLKALKNTNLSCLKVFDKIGKLAILKTFIIEIKASTIFSDILYIPNSFLV